MSVHILKSILVILLASATMSATSYASNETPNSQSVLTTELSVHKNPNCGCCGVWVDHANGQGFSTQVQNHSDLNALKIKLGIPAELHACHTSVSNDGFVFEGHIPARYIKQFLTDKPDGAKGLIVANMPMGSPGMDMGGNFQAYDILLLLHDGSTEVYASITNRNQQ